MLVKKDSFLCFQISQHDGNQIEFFLYDTTKVK